MKSKKKKNIRDVNIGDHVKQIASTRGKKKYGEVLMILQDNPADPTIECMEIDHKHLKPIEASIGKYKKFKTKRSKLKFYVPRKTLFKKEVFEVGKHISYKTSGKTKYGRIVGYLNQEEGLYPHSYDKGVYNGKDLLECIEISTKPGLPRMLDPDGNPKKFIGYPDKCKIVKVINVDSNGKPTTLLKLDIPDVGGD